MHRVLKKDGLIYAEASFMQQVVNAPYDFNRFTHSGLRRLFREFGEIRTGIVGGPGSALAWSIQFFFLSFAQSRPVRAGIRVLCGLSLFWIKYFDYYLVKKPAAYEASSGFYFMGKKRQQPLSDRLLVSFYRGHR
jgi:hypothetical protein